MPNEELKISKIKNGTVIDHIQPGCAPIVLQILGIRFGTTETISVVINVSGKKTPSRKKDIVKIENRELKEEETDKIALVSSRARINIIRDYEVVEKHDVVIPDLVDEIVKCPNPNCITNDSRESTHVVSKFKTTGKDPIVIECIYCSTQIEGDSIINQIKY